MLTLMWMIAACTAGGGVDVGPDPDPAQPALLNAVKPLDLSEDFEQLVEALRADQPGAAEALTARGDDAVPTLVKVIQGHPDLPTRGRAVHALAALPDGGETNVDLALEQLQYDTELPGIVQAWAGAARIARIDDVDTLLAMADTVAMMPALNRPYEQRLTAMSDQLEDISAALTAMATSSNLQPILAPVVLAKGPGPLLEAMLHHPSDPVRRLSAGLLGTLSQQQPGIGAVVAAAYAPDPDATVPLWDGGALYVPMLSWSKADARMLVTHLISWHVFCDVKGLNAQKNQIDNNLASIQLLDPAGFNGRSEWPQRETVGLVEQWGRIHGKRAVTEVLAPWGLESDPRYNGGRR